MAIQIPNLQIKKLLEGLIDIVKNDYINKVATLEEETWLYRTFNGVVYGEFDFYKQVIELLINRDENNPRKLDIRIGFPHQKPNTPSVHIVSPTESQDGINTIGFGSDTLEYYENNDGEQLPIYNRGNKGVYELMITSSNEFEVELIYRLIEALFIANHYSINDNFNGTFKYSGKETISYQELLPYLFIKSWRIELQYTQKVPSMLTQDYLTDVLFVLEQISNI